MVNTNFYATLNELFARATEGKITNVVDYDSFIDAGKQLTTLTSEELQNQFMLPLMNKVQKTIMDIPAYTGAFSSMYAGKLDYGVLENIMGTFYSSDQSVFDGATLVNGETYTDQFKVELPETNVKYYTQSDSWAKYITIRDTDLRGAFTSPEKMDGFISKIFLDIANSSELHRELARLSVVQSIIVSKIAGGDVNTTNENIASQVYSMTAIYNAEMGTTLTQEEALLNEDFTSWTVGVIRDVSKLMQKPSQKFNSEGVTTFTPENYLELKVNSIYDKAIRRSLITAYNKEYGMINMDYEVVPYWQTISDRMKVSTSDTEAGTMSAPILAVLWDKRVCGEMQQIEAVETDRNGRRRYTNYSWQFNYMYWKDLRANAVVFTL